MNAGGELPVVDVATIAPQALLAAFAEHGAVLATDPAVPRAACDTMLDDLRWLFARSDADKAAFAIARSPHFRGHSRMHNERDHREQIHVGRERAPATAAQLAEGPHWRLQGPNLWPDDAEFRRRTLAYVDAVEGVGIRLLHTLGRALGLDAAAWLGDDPYVLGKGIGYHAQPHAGAALRGVAAHLDFSLLTLTLQDDVGGLEVQRPDGRWLAVRSLPAAWLVNVGELLQYVSGNQLVATPHRVVNPSRERTRCSFPVFVNPALDCVLRRPLQVVSCATNPPPGDAGHVHAVLAAQQPPARLPFGPAEWRRKGENVWCRACCAER